MAYPVYYPVAGDTLPHLFDSFDGGTGASITMSGLAVGDIRIYKDGGTTYRASTSGFTLLDTDGIDFNSVTGIHGFSIDLSDNTTAGFYEVGPWYHIVISSITIDSQTVNFVACAFRIVSATRGLAGTALPDAAADAAGGLPISDAGALDLDAQIGTDIDAILADTGTDGVVIADGHLTAAKFGADCITADKIADDAIGDEHWNVTRVTANADQIEGADATDTIEASIQTVIETNKLDHLVAVADADDVVNDSIMAKLVSKALAAADWSDYDRLTDSLEALRDRGDQAWQTGAATGATASYTTESWTRTVGDNDGGAGSDTATVNATYHSTGETTGGTYLEVDVSVAITDGEVGESVDIWGFYNGGGSHYIRVQAYNVTDTVYEDIGYMGPSTSVQRYQFTLTPQHTSAIADTVVLKFLHAGGSGVAAHVLSIDKLLVNTIKPFVDDGSGLTAIPWNAAWDAEVESEVADAFDAEIPAVPTGDSINDYIQRTKMVVVNKKVITNASGNITIYKDNDSDAYCTVNGAFSSVAGETIQLKLE